MNQVDDNKLNTLSHGQFAISRANVMILEQFWLLPHSCLINLNLISSTQHFSHLASRKWGMSQDADEDFSCWFPLQIYIISYMLSAACVLTRDTFVWSLLLSLWNAGRGTPLSFRGRVSLASHHSSVSTANKVPWKYPAKDQGPEGWPELLIVESWML